MAVSVAGTPTVGENGSGLSVSCAVPTGTANGDVLVAFVAHSVASAVPDYTSTGWTTALKITGSSAVSEAAFYRVATSSEPASYTFDGLNGGTAARAAAVIFRLAGVDTTTPLDAAATGAQNVISSTGSVSTPSITTVTNGALVLYGATRANAAAGPTIDGPVQVTKQVETTGTGRRLVTFSEARPTAGATGTRAFTPTDASTLTTIVIALALRAGPISGTGDAQSLTLTIGSGTGSGTPTGPALSGAGSALSLPLTLGAGTGTGLLPTLYHRLVGVPTGTTASVGVRVGNTSSVRLKVGTDPAVSTGVIFGPPVTPDASGNALPTVSGLTPGTRYYYRVAMTSGSETLDTAATVGTFRTAPSGPTNFAFCFSSCTNATDSAAMAAIAARGDDLFLHLGDLYYADGSGNSTANILAKQLSRIEAPNHQAVLATTATGYTPSDHDGMNNGSTAGSDPTVWTNLNSVYRTLWPTPTAPGNSGTGLYYTFTWGRVRFVVWDTRSFATNATTADSSSKTRLGTTQKAWVKATIDAATEPMIVMVNSDPWIGPYVAGEDKWYGYDVERQELAAYFAGTGKKIVMLGGDMHALGADDGTNAPGGITVFQASPLGNNASVKGGPYSAGTYPTSSTGAFVQQYGRVVVNDNGSQVTLAFTGYSSDNTARISLTTSSGFTATGAADLDTLPLNFGLGAGFAAVGPDVSVEGAGSPLALPLTAGAASGALGGVVVDNPDPGATTAVFSTPTQDVYYRIAGRGLIGVQPMGLSVWRVAGVWHTGLSPSADQLAGADRYYQGGYAHAVSDAEIAELTAAGFGDHITLQEVS